MGVRHLGDPWQASRQVARQTRMVQRQSPLASSSVTRGRVRIESAEGLVANSVPGGEPAIQVNGRQSVSGQLDGDGTLDWDGPVYLRDVLDVTAETTLRDVVTVLADLFVTGGGRIKVGTGVTLEPGAGAGKITVGGMVLDPSSHSGYMKMGNNAEVLGFGSNLELYSAGTVKNGLKVTPTGLSVSTLPVAGSLAGLRWLARDATGNIYEVEPGTGGPTGSWEWPFPLSMVTSEFGMRDGRMHNGIDFGAPEGTPIPALSAGTVTGKGYGNSETDGRGHYIVLTHTDGSTTHYFHLVAASPLLMGATVAGGAIIGQVGNTGNSFGAHLHLETHDGGVPINPRTFMAARGV